jgi:hypothetical protein
MKKAILAGLLLALVGCAAPAVKVSKALVIPVEPGQKSVTVEGTATYECKPFQVCMLYVYLQELK